jgi:hypothetical protein
MGSERKPSQESQYKPTARQQEAQKLLEGPQRHTLLVGGARSGKTTLLVHEIVTRALRAGASRHAILRLRANAVRPSIALDTLPKVFRFWDPVVPFKHHRTEGYFSLKNESAGRKDSRQGIRHDLSQRMLADSLFLGAGGADALGAGRR